jgi:hypothetical protein
MDLFRNIEQKLYPSLPGEYATKVPRGFILHNVISQPVVT